MTIMLAGQDAWRRAASPTVIGLVTGLTGFLSTLKPVSHRELDVFGDGTLTRLGTGQPFPTLLKTFLVRGLRSRMSFRAKGF